jgi:hypothetical protein
MILKKVEALADKIGISCLEKALNENYNFMTNTGHL